MSATRDLATLLRDMTPVLASSTYVFCCIVSDRLPLGVDVLCQFREAEGLTAIIEQSDAERLGIKYDFVARMITLAVHSDLAAIGFLSHIAATLAHAGIACNVVSAYHHDHLFVPASRAEEALSLLRALAVSSAIV
ncbi:ACT domain-containing protein [Paraburkholderia caballeronis]|uniref:ACT domain-containing protein n=1 Tax=Paraburkholderia caballeronis TaxID=416943 RepID=UPI0010662BF8|nr:ACT domain-containing protein [Paraburkholderia caballeronis]